MNPANAVISDHLGDAYWMNGRKNEALFQWNHSLVLKEDADMINHKTIKAKAENGLLNVKVLKLKDENLIKNLEQM